MSIDISTEKAGLWTVVGMNVDDGWVAPVTVTPGEQGTGDRIRGAKIARTSGDVVGTTFGVAFSKASLAARIVDVTQQLERDRVFIGYTPDHKNVVEVVPEMTLEEAAVVALDAYVALKYPKAS